MFRFFQDPSAAEGGAAAGEAAGESSPDLGNQAKDLIENPDAALESLKELAMQYGPKLVGALLTLIIGLWVVGKITGGVRKAISKSKVEPMLANFLGGLVGMTLKVLLLIAVLGMVGVETASFAAIIAAAGFAVGMALSGTLGNFASGVMILLFRPFKNGDFVEVAGHSGSVKEITVFMTKLSTPDNKQILIPNSSITSGTITNFSAHDQRRVDLVFGIGYGDDIKKTHEVLRRIIDSRDYVLAEPAPVIAVHALADSSVNFVVRPWVKTADYWKAYWDITETVKLTFDEEGISIPFPQRDVHLYNEN